MRKNVNMYDPKNCKSDKLYNYMKTEHLEKALERGCYASELERLNDPYEYHYIPVEERKNYRVCCLSRSRNAKLMWSHYANGHKGCMVSYKKPKYYLKPSSILKRVKYSSSLPPKNMAISDRLYVKDKKWRSELEIRAVYDSNNHDDSLWSSFEDGKDGKKETNIYLRLEIDAIYLGAETKYEDVEGALRKIAEKKRLRPKKSRLKLKKWSLMIQDTLYYLKMLIVNNHLKKVISCWCQNLGRETPDGCFPFTYMI